MVAAGVVSLFLVVPDDDFGVATFAAPVAAGLAVYGTGRALGHRGRLGPTLAGAALGSLPAHVLYYVGSRAPNDGFWWYLAAEAVHLVGPPVGAAVGFGRSLPAPTLVVLVGPDGEQTAGLALRVAF